MLALSPVATFFTVLVLVLAAAIAKDYLNG